MIMMIKMIKLFITSQKIEEKEGKEKKNYLFM